MIHLYLQIKQRQLFKFFIILSLLIISSVHLKAQSDLSSDELFQQARTAAFDKKDYTTAILLAQKALLQSPNYSDIRIFLGRVYTWSDKIDSARIAFLYVIKTHPDYEDTYNAITDMEYWNDNYLEALKYCNQGLKYHPTSESLLLKKVKILEATKQYNEAGETVDALLKINPKNTKARSLSVLIKEDRGTDKVGISYDYNYFDKQFDDPWHLLSLSYTHPTKLGSVIGRVNYANRFTKNGLQGEVDFYPHISNTFYAYTNIGISGTNSVFPKYRAGISLYANLPWSVEAEAGFRYLHFSSDVWMYTASLGKYYRNFWFNLRGFFVPDNSNISQSYTLTTRYYTGGADDYWYASIGTGISPDDLSTAPILGINTHNKLESQKVGLGYRHLFSKRNIIDIGVTWYHQQYKTNTYGNQIDFGISYQRIL